MQKLRIHVVVLPLPGEPKSLAKPPPFLLLSPAEATLEELSLAIVTQWRKNYPHKPPLTINKLQDSEESDIDLSYIVGDVFRDRDTVKVVQVPTTRESSVAPDSALRPQFLALGGRKRPFATSNGKAPGSFGVHSSQGRPADERSSKRQRLLEIGRDESPEQIDPDRPIPSHEPSEAGRAENGAYNGHDRYHSPGLVVLDSQRSEDAQAGALATHSPPENSPRLISMPDYSAASTNKHRTSHVRSVESMTVPDSPGVGVTQKDRRLQRQVNGAGAAGADPDDSAKSESPEGRGELHAIPRSTLCSPFRDDEKANAVSHAMLPPPPAAQSVPTLRADASAGRRSISTAATTPLSSTQLGTMAGNGKLKRPHPSQFKVGPYGGSQRSSSSRNSSRNIYDALETDTESVESLPDRSNPRKRAKVDVASATSNAAPLQESHAYRPDSSSSGSFTSSGSESSSVRPTELGWLQRQALGQSSSVGDRSSASDDGNRANERVPRSKNRDSLEDWVQQNKSDVQASAQLALTEASHGHGSNQSDIRLAQLPDGDGVVMTDLENTRGRDGDESRDRDESRERDAQLAKEMAVEHAPAQAADTATDARGPNLSTPWKEHEAAVRAEEAREAAREEHRRLFIATKGVEIERERREKAEAKRLAKERKEVAAAQRKLVAEQKKREAEQQRKEKAARVAQEKAAEVQKEQENEAAARAAKDEEAREQEVRRLAEVEGKRKASEERRFLAEAEDRRRESEAKEAKDKVAKEKVARGQAARENLAKEKEAKEKEAMEKEAKEKEKKDKGAHEKEEKKSRDKGLQATAVLITSAVKANDRRRLSSTPLVPRGQVPASTPSRNVGIDAQMPLPSFLRRSVSFADELPQSGQGFTPSSSLPGPAASTPTPAPDGSLPATSLRSAAKVRAGKPSPASESPRPTTPGRKETRVLPPGMTLQDLEKASVTPGSTKKPRDPPKKVQADGKVQTTLKVTRSVNARAQAKGKMKVHDPPSPAKPAKEIVISSDEEDVASYYSSSEDDSTRGTPKPGPSGTYQANNGSSLGSSGCGLEPTTAPAVAPVKEEQMPPAKSLQASLPLTGLRSPPESTARVASPSASSASSRSESRSPARYLSRSPSQSGSEEPDASRSTSASPEKGSRSTSESTGPSKVSEDGAGSLDDSESESESSPGSSPPADDVPVKAEASLNETLQRHAYDSSSQPQPLLPNLPASKPAQKRPDGAPRYPSLTTLKTSKPAYETKDGLAARRTGAGSSQSVASGGFLPVQRRPSGTDGNASADEDAESSDDSTEGEDEEDEGSFDSARKAGRDGRGKGGKVAGRITGLLNSLFPSSAGGGWSSQGQGQGKSQGRA
ncbi:MAG: hypothetical protein M1832_005647 [Thelocarpon impressellum]|nr:MAG: hypothetical protein M1832_005647 [Thelocarpon impressellum]